MRLYLTVLTLALSSAGVAAQGASQDDIYRIGPGITPPKLLRKVEPEFTGQARNAGVQGIVALDIVVGLDGRPSDISIISPLGFGLDERAEEAIRKWEFKPAAKDGKPVKMGATVQVNFRFRDAWYDATAERHRTAFNSALSRLKTNAPRAVEEARKTILELADKKFPAAMYVLATWMEEGTAVAKDQEQALKLFSYAAEKNYGPALYEIGRMHIEGRQLPLDSEKGLQLVRDAAVLGSPLAQFHVGNVYETGKGVARDSERAERNFRLCAAARQPACQFRLAQLLLKAPARPERKYIQAIAWLQLASESGLPQARAVLDQELPKLTADQRESVAKLKTQLIPAVK